MNVRSCLKVLLSAGGILFFLHPAQAQKTPGISPPSPQLNLQRCLPAASDLQGWTPKDAPQNYQGEDLFAYIDGGAEIYYEYGFKQVVVQDYQDKKGKTITLEIFEMADSESAFGMFSFKSSGKGQPCAIGQDARLEDYYLNFWKGACLVTLTGFDAGQDSRRGILEIARAVDLKIPLRGTRPSLLGLLPEEWAAAPRLVYFRGFLGLYNIYPFFTQDVFRFKEGLAAEEDQSKFFLLRYASPAEAHQRYQDVQKAFAQSPAYKDMKRPDDRFFEVVDARGNKLQVQTSKDHISLILIQIRKDRPSLSDARLF